jgi:hypothetical protein
MRFLHPERIYGTSSAGAPLSPSSHSTFLFSTACGLLLRNGAPQPLCLQSLPDSFHCNGGVPPSRGLHRPPLLRSPRFPAVHPFSLQPLTKCSSRNSFVLTTIHFHGGCTPPSRKVLWSYFDLRASVSAVKAESFLKSGSASASLSSGGSLKCCSTSNSMS